MSSFTSKLLLAAALLLPNIAVSSDANIDIRNLQNAIEAAGANWTAGETSLTSLSDAERRALLMSAEPMQAIGTERETAPAVAEDLPAYFSWGDYLGHNWMSPIRNMQQCGGACVAFSLTGAYEAAYRHEIGFPGLEVTLSPQHIVSCFLGDCGGAMAREALDPMMSEGCCVEACFPYVASADPCTPCSGWEDNAYKISSWSGLYGRSEEEIKTEIAEHGPVMAIFDVYQDFYNYAGGVYEHISGTYAGATMTVLYGWDDSEDCWLGRHQWGTWWGEEGPDGRGGWYRIKKGVDECGIESYIYSMTPIPHEDISVDLDVAEGASGPGQIEVDTNVRFMLSFSNETGEPLKSVCNGYRVYSPDGASWQPINLDTVSRGWPDRFDSRLSVSYRSAGGSGADTVGLVATALAGEGLPEDFADSVYWIATRVYPEDIGKHLCIDTAFLSTQGTWKWATEFDHDAYPRWHGPYCFEIVENAGGTAWRPIGSGLNYPVRTFVEYDSSLIAGGMFTNVGTNSVKRVARWDGAAWQPLGSGLGGPVYCLEVYNGELTAGGLFLTPGYRVASWDGTSWQPLGSGVSGAVYCLAVYNGELVAGGLFTSAGGVSVNNIARWDGSEWQALGGGLNSVVYALEEYDGELYAGGSFTVAGSADAYYVARWNGSEWQTLGDGLNGVAHVLGEYNGELIVGGAFGWAGSANVGCLAAWNGIDWHEVGSYGMDTYVRALTVYGDELIAGGHFTTADGAGANRVARWDGSSWNSLGSGVNDIVYALTEFEGELVTGGEFTVAGGLDVDLTAAWFNPAAASAGCCLPPTVGDVDQSGGVDITDISVLVDNQFLTLQPLVCDAEGDCDFSGEVDITDLSIMIDNQFLTLTPLPPCP